MTVGEGMGGRGPDVVPRTIKLSIRVCSFLLRKTEFIDTDL
jgi:hypothetical protein